MMIRESYVSKGCDRVSHHLYIKPIFVHAEACTAAHKGLHDAVAVLLQQERLRLGYEQDQTSDRLHANSEIDRENDTFYAATTK